MEKLIARYFYTPICPESFATLERLKALFAVYDVFEFEFFDTAHDDMQSSIPWFTEELQIINTLAGEVGQPLFFGKLFIQGESIKGFPPSPKNLSEVFTKHGVVWDPVLYPFAYQFMNRPRWDCRREEFNYKPYTSEVITDTCRLCTQFHPYLDEQNYDSHQWKIHEEEKCTFLSNALQADQMIGVMAYFKQEPAGFVEAFTLNIAAKLGFPVISHNTDSMMITCLSVRTEASGYGVGSQLVRELEAIARSRKYRTVQVVPFPDEHNWQPISFYKKLGFAEMNDPSETVILGKRLNF